MGNQRINPTKGMEGDRQSSANSASQPESPIAKLQEVLGNRAGSDRFKTDLDRYQQLGSKDGAHPLDALLTSVGAARPAKTKPQFRGLSHELQANPASSGMVVQAKMTVRPAGDRYEQEADRMAAQVVKQIHSSPVSSANQSDATQPPVHAEASQPKTIQPKGVQSGVSAEGGVAVTPNLEASINSARKGGQPLPDAVREPMEQALGADFSGVRVHTDERSDALNRSISAQAFTTGQDVFFQQGAYQPGSRWGQELLAHELAHVMQQNRVPVIQRKKIEKFIYPDTARTLEVYADREWIFRYEIYGRLWEYFRYFVKTEYEEKQANYDVQLCYNDFETLMDQLKEEVDKGGRGDEQNNTVIRTKVEEVREALSMLVFHLNLLEDSSESYKGLYEKDANLPRQYDSFCDLLYANKEIMEQTTEGLDDAIYKLYTESSLGSASESLFQGIDNWNDYIRTAYNYYYDICKESPTCYLQNSERKVVKVLAYLDRWLKTDNENEESKIEKKIKKEGWFTDFVYTDIEGKAVARVYANLGRNELGRVANYLLRVEGVSSFKFSGPGDFGTRADALVVYCLSQRVALGIAETLDGQCEINQGAPAMTTPVGSKGGVGVGAEPKWVATGMRTRVPEVPRYKEEPSAEAQSFGSVRSELIASAIIHYRENRKKAQDLNIDDKELFKRFVAIALKGWKKALEPEGL